MVRNPDWWGSSAIRTTSIGSSTSRSPIPRSVSPHCCGGDLDLLTDPPFSALDQIRSTPGLKLAEATELRTIWLGLDQGSAELRSSNIKGANPFKDKRVRQAIYQAIDIEAIRKDLMRGLGNPGGHAGRPGANGYAPELDQRLPYDPEEAKTVARRGRLSGRLQRDPRLPEQLERINDEAICRAVAAQLGKDRYRGHRQSAAEGRSICAKIDNRESDFFFDSWVDDRTRSSCCVNGIRPETAGTCPATPIRGSTS